MDRLNLDLLRSTRNRTLSLFESLAQEDLDFVLTAGRWSLGEILDHILKADTTYTSQLLRLVALAKSGRRPMISVSLAEMDYAVPWVPRALLPLADLPLGVFNLFVPTSVRETLLRNRIFPVKAPETMQPARGRLKEDLREELIESHGVIETLFEENPGVDFSRFRYYHPLFGYNRVPEILALLVSHEQRHQQQFRIVLSGVRARQNRQAA